MKRIGGKINTYLGSFYGESLSDKYLIVRNLLRVLLKYVKIKLPLCLIKRRVMKVYEGTSGGITLCIIDTGTRWSGQLTALAPILQENQPPLPTNWLGFSMGFKDCGFHFKTFYLSQILPSLQ